MVPAKRTASCSNAHDKGQTRQTSVGRAQGPSPCGRGPEPHGGWHRRRWQPAVHVHLAMCTLLFAFSKAASGQVSPLYSRFPRARHLYCRVFCPSFAFFSMKYSSCGARCLGVWPYLGAGRVPLSSTWSTCVRAYPWLSCSSFDKTKGTNLS